MTTTDRLYSGHQPRFSVAPMMEWTDRHCRAFHRQLSSRALLYTEMVTTGAIIHGDRDHLLGFSGLEQPIACQLGGSDPQDMAASARIVAGYGYDEVNINVGCPSDRVQAGRFGACLMDEPERVADCVRAMREAVAKVAASNAKRSLQAGQRTWEPTRCSGSFRLWLQRGQVIPTNMGGEGGGVAADASSGGERGDGVGWWGGCPAGGDGRGRVGLAGTSRRRRVGRCSNSGRGGPTPCPPTCLRRGSGARAAPGNDPQSYGTQRPKRPRGVAAPHWAFPGGRLNTGPPPRTGFRRQALPRGRSRPYRGKAPRMPGSQRQLGLPPGGPGPGR